MKQEGRLKSWEFNATVVLLWTRISDSSPTKATICFRALAIWASDTCPIWLLEFPSLSSFLIMIFMATGFLRSRQLRFTNFLIDDFESRTYEQPLALYYQRFLNSRYNWNWGLNLRWFEGNIIADWGWTQVWGRWTVVIKFSEIMT